MKRRITFLTLLLVMTASSPAPAGPHIDAAASARSGRLSARTAHASAVGGGGPLNANLKAASGQQSSGGVMDGHPYWSGDFNGDEQEDILTYNPGTADWHLGAFIGNHLSWSHAGNTIGFGQIWGGCLFWSGNFAAEDRTQILFYYPGDGNWWLGSHDGRQLRWSLVGNTKSFGNGADGRPYWVDDFNGDGRADVLFYNPGDANWWLGTFVGQSLRWSYAGNTSSFGQIADGRPFWVNDFTGGGAAEILFYHPGDGNWWLGTYEGGRLRWSYAGNTSRFGPLWGVCLFWIGDFSGNDQAQVLFHHPGDGSWWLGSHDGQQLRWTHAGNTRGFGNPVDGRPFWSDDFNGDGQDDVLFYYPGDGNWWLGTYIDGQFRWNLMSSTPGLGNPMYGRPSWTGDFVGEGRVNVLFFNPSDGNWFLGPPSPVPFNQRVGRRVARNADGRLELFGRGMDGAIYHKYQLVPNGGWSVWEGLGGYLVSEPVAGVNEDGRLEVFAIGRDNVLYHIYQEAPNSGWAQWESLGGSVDSNVAVATNADGRLEVFARGTDGALYHKYQLTAGGVTWSAWESLGGYLTSSPAVGVNRDGRLEVFVRGTDGALYHRWQSAPNSGWAAWEGMGGYLSSDPVVGSNADGRLEVFTAGPGWGVYHIYQLVPNGGWSYWDCLGGITATSGPSVASNQDGRLEVFVRGTDGAIHHRWQSAPNSGWAAWESMGGYLASAPVAASNADGRLEIFALGTGSTLHHIYQLAPNSGWSIWESLGCCLRNF